MPVLPAAIIGGHESMPKGSNWPKRGRPPVGVVFGEPIVPHKDETAKELTERVRAAVGAVYESHYEWVMGRPYQADYHSGESDVHRDGVDPPR